MTNVFPLTSESDPVWYLEWESREQGPFTLADLRQLAIQNQIKPGTSLRRSDGQRHLASQIIDFSSPSPPIPPSSHVYSTSPPSDPGIFTWDEIRNVGRSQRWINLAFLGMIFLFFVSGNAANDPLTTSGPMFWVEFMLFVILAMVVVIQFSSVLWMATALKYRHPLWWAFGSSVPYFGGIVLLWLSGTATSLLRAQGLKVGFLGARVPDLPPVDWSFAKPQ